MSHPKLRTLDGDDLDTVVGGDGSCYDQGQYDASIGYGPAPQGVCWLPGSGYTDGYNSYTDGGGGDAGGVDGG